jgi:hypothetical protein
MPRKSSANGRAPRRGPQYRKPASRPSGRKPNPTSNGSFHEIVQRHGGAALAALERAIEHKNEQATEDLDETVRCLVALRDGIIALARQGEPRSHWLDEVNALLSTVVSTEFPVDGFHWDNVCRARDTVKHLLGEA